MLPRSRIGVFVTLGVTASVGIASLAVLQSNASHRQGTSSAKPDEVNDSDPYVPDRVEVDELQRRVRALELRLAAQQSEPRPNAPVTAAAAANPASVSSAAQAGRTTEEEQADEQARLLAKEDQFKRSPRQASAWGLQEQTELRQLVDHSRIGKMRSLECRDNSCRLEMDYESQDQVGQFIRVNDTSPALQGTTGTIFPLDASHTHVVYFIEPTPTGQPSSLPVVSPADRL